VLTLAFNNAMRTFAVLGLVLLLVGCASERPYKGATLIRYTNETFPPSSDVEVFSHDVDKPYTIIGELKMTFSPELSHEEMVNRMKGVSREIGADAIIGLEREEVEVEIPRVFEEEEPIKTKARHQPLDVPRPEAREEKILLRGLAVRYR
jgi:ABC-type thiamine transport system substrate-binding protein